MSNPEYGAAGSVESNANIQGSKFCSGTCLVRVSLRGVRK